MPHHPLDLLLNWTKELSVDDQIALAGQILLYIPNYSLPENLESSNFFLLNLLIISTNTLMNQKKENAPKIIGVVLCIRSIITYILKRYKEPVDDQILGQISLQTALMEKLQDKWDAENIEKLRSLSPNPADNMKWTEIYKNWQFLSTNKLSDESLSKWLLSIHSA